VIHKTNGGLSDARNAGMAIAGGEYIGFIDSDDYIAPAMYQLLLERLQVDGSDISACGVDMVYEDGSAHQRLTPEDSCVLSAEAAVEAVVRESWLKQPVWYKLYKAELVRDIRFPVGKYHEDIFWTWQAVARAQKVSIFDTPCYYYVQRSGSIMAEKYTPRRLDAIEAKQQRLAFLIKEYPRIAEYARKDLAFSCMYHGQLAIRDLDVSGRKAVLAKLKAVLKESTGCCGKMPATHKCWLLLAKLNMNICCKLRNKLGIGL
jgi:glycosyltransferase involved in cell wall biosynthesis